MSYLYKISYFLFIFSLTYHVGYCENEFFSPKLIHQYYKNNSDDSGDILEYKQGCRWERQIVADSFFNGAKWARESNKVFFSFFSFIFIIINFYTKLNFPMEYPILKIQFG